MNAVDLKKGFELALENSKHLFDDAQLLKNSDRYPRAYTLFQLAIEEVGKCFVIWFAIIEYYSGTTINEKYLKDNGFLCHKKKTERSLAIEIFAIELFERHIGRKTNLRKEVEEEKENLKLINDRKNLSLYVSIENNLFVSPSSIITKEMVQEIGVFVVYG